MGLDLSTSIDTAAKEDEGRTITLYDECGEPYLDPDTGAPITAHVVGTYSTRMKKHIAKMIARRARTPGRPTPEQQDEDQREQWAGAVVRWDLLFGTEMAPPAKIFALKQHIYDQVVMAANDHAAFFAQSLTKSAAVKL